MANKIISDTRLLLDLALLWALNAKNSPQNVAGLSSFQLVFGRNPKFPSTLTDNETFRRFTRQPKSPTLNKNSLQCF